MKKYDFTSLKHALNAWRCGRLWASAICLLGAMGPAASIAQDAGSGGQPLPFAAFDMAGPEILNDPHDLDFGPDGNLYVADKFANRIAVLDPKTLDLIREIAPGQLPGVHDISFDANGRAAIAVTGLSTVLVYDRLDIANPEPRYALPAPRTEGALFHSNGRVYATAGGTGAVIAYEEGVPVALAEGHYGAHDIEEAPDGSVWVADNFNRRLVRYSADLVYMQTIDHTKYGFTGARYVDIDRFGRLIVADQDAHRILMIDPTDGPDGSLVGVLGDGAPGKGRYKFDDPEGVVWRDNQYFFADSDNNRIVRYSVVMN